MGSYLNHGFGGPQKGNEEYLLDTLRAENDNIPDERSKEILCPAV
jgi:hypothetical protein